MLTGLDNKESGSLFKMTKTIHSNTEKWNSEKQVQLVAIGGNSLREGAGPQEVLDMYEDLIIKTQKLKGYHLIIASLLSSLESSTRLDNDFQEFDSKLEKMIKKYPDTQVNFLNLNLIFRNRDGKMKLVDFDKKKTSKRDIHLSFDGTFKLAKKINDCVFALSKAFLK